MKKAKKIFKTNLYLLALILVCGCSQTENNVEMSKIEERITGEIKIENPIVTDLRGNREVSERYGLPLNKIEDGFVYTCSEHGKNADEIVIVKVKDKKSVVEVERALESEITGLTSAWEGADKTEYEKVQRHVLRSKGRYVMLAITSDNKKVEDVFKSLF